MNPEKQNIVQLKFLAKRLIYLFTTIIFLVMVLFIVLFFNSSITAWFQNSDTDLDSLYIDTEKKVISTNPNDKISLSNNSAVNTTTFLPLQV